MRLSIVVPVFNESRIVAELVGRCAEAGQNTGLAAELVVVNDASTDETAQILRRCMPVIGIKVVTMEKNVGQFRATQEGLRQSSGDWIVVLDGDLQDPPDLIPVLVKALSSAPPGVKGVFGIKRGRKDSTVFMLGQRAYSILQRLAGRSVYPTGAGSYCLLPRFVAAAVASAPLRNANLAAVVVALGIRVAEVGYEKGSRYDGKTRVGYRGLLREALGSLSVTGALPRILGGLSLALAGGGFAVLLRMPSEGFARLAAMIIGGGMLVGMGWLASRKLDRKIVEWRDASIRAIQTNDPVPGRVVQA